MGQDERDGRDEGQALQVPAPAIQALSSSATEVAISAKAAAWPAAFGDGAGRSMRNSRTRACSAEAISVNVARTCMTARLSCSVANTWLNSEMNSARLHFACLPRADVAFPTDWRSRMVSMCAGGPAQWLAA